MKKWVSWLYGPDQWLVGFWEKNGNFAIHYQRKTAQETAALVNYLNGGQGLPIDVIVKLKPKKAMWVFKRFQDTILHVGYFLPNGDWYTAYELATQFQAELLVNYLNGGTGAARQVVPDPTPEPEPEPDAK